MVNDCGSSKRSNLIYWKEKEVGKKQEGMQQRLEMVQFTVARLEDIRTLLLRWRAVLAELQDNQFGLQGVIPTLPPGGGGGGA